MLLPLTIYKGVLFLHFPYYCRVAVGKFYTSTESYSSDTYTSDTVVMCTTANFDLCKYKKHLHCSIFVGFTLVYILLSLKAPVVTNWWKDMFFTVYFAQFLVQKVYKDGTSHAYQSIFFFFYNMWFILFSFKIWNLYFFGGAKKNRDLL